MPAALEILQSQEKQHLVWHTERGEATKHRLSFVEVCYRFLSRMYEHLLKFEVVFFHNYV